MRGQPLSPVPLWCKVEGLPLPVAEHRFHPTRRWRFDWSWPPQLVALEIDGGAWNQGRHTRGRGFVADQEKLNHATVLGWRVFRCTPQTLIPAMQLIKQVLER